MKIYMPNLFWLIVIFVFFLLMCTNCGGQDTDLRRDAGVPSNINTFDWVTRINTYCKEWKTGRYFDLGQNKWMNYQWCNKW
jgi:hypothetical protein